MTPEEAKRLLDAQKGDEQVLQLKPQGKARKPKPAGQGLVSRQTSMFRLLPPGVPDLLLCTIDQREQRDRRRGGPLGLLDFRELTQNFRARRLVARGNVLASSRRARRAKRGAR